MWMIRVVVTVAAVVIILIVGLLMHVLFKIIGHFNEKAADRFLYGYVHGALKVVWALGGGKVVRTIGLEQVPTDRPVCFIGNHRSIFDVVLTGAQLKTPMGYVAKQELAKIPILALLMRDIHCLFLNREDPREGLKTILKAIEYCKNGTSMFIFPEGTRAKTEGELLPFHAGSFKIATKAGVPIVPVTIVGTGEILEDHFPKLRRAKVVIEYGAPIEVKGLDRKAQNALPEQVRDLMVETYARNARLIAKK